MTDGEIYANIVPDPSTEVWGVVYLCDTEALLKMDEFEGVADGCYRRISVTVERDSGEQIEATAYIAGEDFWRSGQAQQRISGPDRFWGTAARIARKVRQNDRRIGGVDLEEDSKGGKKP